MKHVLLRLERSRTFWGLLVLSSLFFALRLPSLIEPYWYGDEGIYEIIGMAIRRGHLLYSGIWDNKPPLLYIIYAIFDGNQFWVRVFSLLIGLLAMIVFFFLAQKLFKKQKISLILTAFFGFFFATPFLEGNIANAENFMLLPIILAGLLLYRETEKKHTDFRFLFVSGFLLGIAFITKIVALFDFAGFLVFAFLLFMQGRTFQKQFMPTLNAFLKTAVIFFLGFLIPFLLCCLYFLSTSTLKTFISATFLSNVGYVGYGNTFFIPQGLLIVKCLLLVLFVLVLLRKRDKIAKPTLFILAWLGFSLFNAFFSQRPYTHYVLVLLPSFILFGGWVFSDASQYAKGLKVIVGIILLVLVFQSFQIHTVKWVTSYYNNYLSYIAGRKSVSAYRTFFDSGTQGTYDLSLFITTHEKPQDKVFVWGNNAQIYVLSGKLPPGRFTVAYHILGSKQNIMETKQALDETRPKYIIALNNVPALPFQTTGYQVKFSTDNALIYERLY